MKRLLIITAISLALAAWLGVVLSLTDLGNVTIDWGGKYVIDMNFLVAAFFLLLFLLALWLLKLVFNVLRVKAIRRWWKRRVRSKVNLQMDEGFLALNQGNWSKAAKQLMSVADKSDHPSLVYIAAAQAAEANNDAYQADALLEEAAKDAKWFNTAKLERADFLIGRGEYEQAETAFEELSVDFTKNSIVNQKLVLVYEKLGRWKKLIKLLPKLDIKKLNLSSVEFTAWSGYLIEASELEDAQSRKTNLLAGWREMPHKLRDHKAMQLNYCELLRKANLPESALSTLCECLDTKWDEDLIRLFGVVVAEKPEKQLKQAEKWLQDNAQSPNLYLSLGRIGLRNKLWGKARDYFSQSTSIKPNQEALAELARLNYMLGENEASLVNLEQQVKLMSQDLPVFPDPEIRV